MEDLSPYLEPTYYVESDHPAVVRMAHTAAGGADDSAEVARRLFYWVRDEVRYNPYQELWKPGIYKASYTLELREGYCVQKATLLAAMARALGMPARLGFADLRNHKTPPRLFEAMGTNLFVFHGFTELHLGGRWLKATPAFDADTCKKSDALTVEFDGEVDAILHPVDAQGRPHMEYVGSRGSYADVPLDEIFQAFQETYSATWESVVG